MRVDEFMADANRTLASSGIKSLSKNICGMSRTSRHRHKFRDDEKWQRHKKADMNFKILQKWYCHTPVKYSAI